MNTYGAQQLATSFRNVRKNTIQVAEDIPESQYGFSAAPGTRTVGQMLMHLATCTRMWQDAHGNQQLTDMAKYDFLKAMVELEIEETKPRTKAEIIALLQKEGDTFADWLGTLSDEFLAQEITETMGAKKTRFEALLSAKEHEMHHRGQLMLIERMLGIVPHLTRRYADFEKQYNDYKAAYLKEKAAQSAKEPQLV